jgi:hypothetical protein
MVFSLLSVTAWADEAVNVAKIEGGESYATLNEAIEKAESGAVITLLDNLTVTSSLTIDEGKNIVLDLGGKTMTLASGARQADAVKVEENPTGMKLGGFMLNKGTLTIQNGTITDTTTSSGAYIVLNTGTLTLANSVKITALNRCALGNYKGTVNTEANFSSTKSDINMIETYGGTVKMTGGSITNTAYGSTGVIVFNSAYATSVTTSQDAAVYISGGSITTNLYPVSTNNVRSGKSSVTITDATLTAARTGIYWPSAGTLTLGTNSSNGPSITATTPVEICCGTLVVNSGTYTSTYKGTVSWTSESLIYRTSGSTGTGYRNDSGAKGPADALTIVANRAGSVNSGYDDTELCVTINGGEFISPSCYGVRYLDCNYVGSGNPTGKYISGLQGASITITGGTFNGSLGALDLETATDNKAVGCVSGGTFSKEIAATYLADTYVCKQSDSNYIVYAPATSLKINEEETEVAYAANKTIQLTTTTTPATITNSIAWASDNTDVATVSNNGKVTLKKAGTANITASVDGLTATYQLTVTKGNVSSLKLTPSTTSLEGGGTVTMTVAVEPTAADVEVTCSDTSITVSKNSDGTFTATLPNATVQYTFTAAVKSTDPCYQGSVTLPVSVTRYVAATTSASTSTSNKTDKTDDKTDDTATTLPTETGDVANTQVAPEVVSVETVTDAETGTVTTTTEKSDGSTTVVEEKTDGTVTTTDTSAEGAVKVVEKTTDGTVTTTDTAVNGVETYTKEVPGEQIKATVTIPEEVESAVVTIPVSGELTSGMVAMDADTGEIIMLSALTEDGLSLKLDSSRNIVIVDNSKSFTDVAADNWAADGVSFASSRGILIGTGENTFAPDATLDRRTALTGLARLAGIDTTGGDTWYEQAVEWAKETGISDGSNLEGNLPREQLATLLYRAAGSPEVDSSDVRYTDADQISSYATDAIAWATENGIMTGNPDGSVNPNGTANRAQYSTMLSRYAAYQMNH